MSELTIRDAFKALEDVDIDVTPKEKERVIRSSKDIINESAKRKHVLVEGVKDIVVPKGNDIKSRVRHNRNFKSLDKKEECVIKEDERDVIDRELFISLKKLENGVYSVLNDGYFVKKIFADNDEDAKKQFRDWLKHKNEAKARLDRNRLHESEKIDIGNEEDVKKGKELLDKEKEETPLVIVNGDEENQNKTPEELRGKAVLQCKVCKGLNWFDPEKIVKGEDSEGDEVYNLEDECAICRGNEGFIYVGQLTFDEEEGKEEPVEEEPIEDAEESHEDENDEEEVDDEPKEDDEEEDEDFALESLDSRRFDKLVNKYLNNIYENFESFTSTKGKIDDNSNTLIVEGVITFKDNKTKNTEFIFESCARTSSGEIKFKGSNKTFTEAKSPFTLVGKIRNNRLVSESMIYNYVDKSLNESLAIKGKVTVR